MTGNIFKICFLLIIFFTSGCDDKSRDDLDKKAFDTLLQALDNNDRCMGIHAESLLDLGGNDRIQEYFLGKLENYADTPQYRIDIWRVLTLASNTEEEKISPKKAGLFQLCIA